MAQPYVGEIRMFAGNFAPAGWAFCDGALQPISELETLFNLIGTTYGGDGQSTFALPDLRGRVPIHQGNGFVLAETGGAEQVTLTINQIPLHTHALGVQQAMGNQISPGGNVPAQSLNVTPYINDAPSGSFSASPAQGTDAIGPVGGSQPHENMQPYLGINYIISLFGIFPSQS
jgi:microcystin-dependent protein